MVAVGGWVNAFEVTEVASFPAEQHVLSVRSYSALADVRAKLSAAVCDGASGLGGGRG